MSKPDMLAILARQTIERNFDEILSALLEWKKREYAVRDVIEMIGSDDDLRKAQADCGIAEQRLLAAVVSVCA